MRAISFWASRAACLLAVLLGFVALPSVLAAAEAAGKFEAQLIWGTNEDKSPDAKHKEVEPALKKKLQELPLKWKNYFEVERKTFEVSSQPKRITMSKKCEIEVRNLPLQSVEVSLIGEGAPILKRTQALPKGETLVLGGNAPNSTSWLVVVKRAE